MQINEIKPHSQEAETKIGTEISPSAYGHTSQPLKSSSLKWSSLSTLLSVSLAASTLLSVSLAAACSLPAGFDFSFAGLFSSSS